MAFFSFVAVSSVPLISRQSHELCGPISRPFVFVRGGSYRSQAGGVAKKDVADDMLSAREFHSRANVGRALKLVRITEVTLNCHVGLRRCELGQSSI